MCRQMSLRTEVHMKLYVKYLHNRLKNKAELPETKRSSEAEPQEMQLSIDLCQQALYIFIIYTEL